MITVADYSDAMHLKNRRSENERHIANLSWVNHNHQAEEENQKKKKGACDMTNDVKEQEMKKKRMTQRVTFPKFHKENKDKGTYQ